MKLKENPLVKNFISLSVLQASNYLFPLITLPYLVRTLGPANYGLVNFAAAFTAYFGLLTDYGFNLSATREVSVNRNNKTKLIQIYNSVLLIKLVLYIISALIVVIIVETIPFFRNERFTYYLSIGVIFGSTIFPVWYFQGLEEMKYITMLNIIFKSIATVLIFIFVIGRNDYNILIVINSAGYLAIGLASLVIIRFRFGIYFTFPSIEEILYQLKEGWYIFISTIGISIYTISNTFILGLFASTTVVGYFSAADKIRNGVSQLMNIVSQTVYPHLSNMFAESMQKGLRFTKKLLIWGGSVALLLSVLLCLFSREIVLVVLGKNYISSIPVLQIICWLVFIIFISNILGIQTMLNLNFTKAFSKIILFAAFVNLCLSFCIVPYYFEKGTAFSVLITEVIVTISMLLFLHKKKIRLLNLDV